MRFPILDSIEYYIKHIQIQSQEEWYWEKNFKKKARKKNVCKHMSTNHNWCSKAIFYHSKVMFAVALNAFPFKPMNYNFFIFIWTFSFEHLFFFSWAHSMSLLQPFSWREILWKRRINWKKYIYINHVVSIYSLQTKIKTRFYEFNHFVDKAVFINIKCAAVKKPEVYSATATWAVGKSALILHGVWRHYDSQ